MGPSQGANRHRRHDHEDRRRARTPVTSFSSAKCLSLKKTHQKHWHRGSHPSEPICWWKRYAACNRELFILDHKIMRRPPSRPILKKQDGLVDFSRSATEIVNRLRGFQPWPGAYTIFRGSNLQIRKAAPIAQALPPGQLVVDENVCWSAPPTRARLNFSRSQPEGKKRMSRARFREWLSAHECRKAGSSVM